MIWGLIGAAIGAFTGAYFGARSNRRGGIRYTMYGVPVPRWLWRSLYGRESTL